MYLAIQSQAVQTYLTHRLTTYFSNKMDVNIHIGGVQVALFNKIVLEDVWVEDERGDTLAWSARISANLSSISFPSKFVRIDRFTIDRSRFTIKQDSTGRFNFQFLLDSLGKDTLSQSEWKFSCNTFRLKNSGFVYRNQENEPSEYRLDDMNLRIDQFRLYPDSLSMKVASLTLIDSKGFYLNDLSADLRSANGKFNIRNLTFETLNSKVDSASFSFERRDLPGGDGKRVVMGLELRNAMVSMADVALFVPSLKGMNQELEITGHFSGNLQNLKAKDLTLKTGEYTLIDCDLSVDLLEGMREPFLFVDINRLRTDFRDLSRIRLPSGAKNSYLSFPANLMEMGNFTYEGNFTGFISDFVAYGTLKSPMGLIKTDISFVPVAGNNIRYKGKLETAGFQTGKLLHTKNLGDISFNGMVDGLYNKKRKTINGNFNGTVTSLMANNYTYSNIKLNGNLNNKKFEGSVSVNDPNLKLSFKGLLNLDNKVPVFDFILNLDKADLVALHLDTLQKSGNLEFEMAANFSGSNLDNLEGLIQVYNGKYTNQNNTLAFDNLTINTHLDDKLSQINLTSDYFDLSVVGTYHFKSLIESVRIVLSRYLPALDIPLDGRNNTNQFAFDFHARDLDEITAVFLPAMKITTPFLLSGRIDSKNATLEMESNIPAVIYDQFALGDISVKVTPLNENLSSVIRLKELRIKNGLALSNIALLLDASSDRIGSRVTWNNTDKLSYSGEINSEVLFTGADSSRNLVVDIGLKPSRIIMADTVWHLSPATFRIDGRIITVNGFSFSNNTQEISADGIISPDESEQLSMSFKNMNLSHLETYLNNKLGIKGMINGTISISDFYKSRRLDSDLQLTGFEYMDQPIGDVSLGSKWDRSTRLINGEMRIVRNGRIQTSASGYFNPENQEMDFTVDLNNQSVVILGSVIRETMSNFHGDGTGRVRVHGTPEKILMDGAVFCKNAGLTIDFTQVTYNFSDSVRFSGDRFIFRNIEVTDFLGNKGTFNGSIRHDSFKNMDYNLGLTSGKILALNTTMKQNESFYGKAIVRGELSIRGHDNDVKLSGSATSLPETAVTIILGDEAEVARYDFIRFVKAEKDTLPIPAFIPRQEEGGIVIDLLIHATPEAKVQMVYNTQISDMIRAQGDGTLRFEMDKQGNIYLSGNFVLEQGEYLFTLQNVINKRFSVEPGGSVTWSGNPYDAIIDLHAVYKLKASLYELMVGSIENKNSSQRIPVECKIILTGELINPDINFDIIFPELETRLKDELQQYFSTQEDLNRQILSLLVLGKFYTPEFVRGSYETNTSGLIGNTASDLFSNGLSNWLSQINQDVDIGFNYRPGNQVTNDEIELALSTQIFNDRVSINGNIGNNTNPRALNNSELVGDFEINVKLTPSGKIQLKAYNKSNNNLIYETAPYTQGLGISYKENYNVAGELWKNFKALFRKKAE